MSSDISPPLAGWHTTDVVVPRPQQDRWICARLGAFDLDTHEEVFFVRVETPRGVHRLRFRAPASSAALLDSIAEAAGADGYAVSKTLFVPEWERYLGPDGVSLALRWFARSSRETLAVLQESGVQPLGLRLARCLLTAVQWTDALQAAATMRESSLRYEELWPCWSTRFTSYLATLEDIDPEASRLAVSERCAALYERKGQRIVERAAAFRGDADNAEPDEALALLAAQTASLLANLVGDLGRQDIVFFWASILHMHFLRMGIENVDEFFIYYALSQLPNR